VQIEALIFSADAAEASLNTIRLVAIEYREQIVEAPRAVHVSLFTHAWTIVDCLHVARQVLTALNYQTPLAVAFQRKYECAHTLRNKMDHLSENALNVAKSKGRPPIHGALAYVCIPERNIVEKDGEVTFTGGGMVMLTTGRFAGGEIMRLVNPGGRRFYGPVSGFRLEAFDAFLELDEGESDLRALVIEVNDRSEKEFDEFARTASQERAIPIEKLTAHPGGAMSIFLAFEAGPTPPQQDNTG
jgi:hypothetical protein